GLALGACLQSWNATISTFARRDGSEERSDALRLARQATRSACNAGPLAITADRLLDHLTGEDRPAFAVFDLNHPEIGVPPDLAGDVGVGRRLVDRCRAGRAQPGEIAQRGAGLRQHGDTALELVEFDQDGAGILVAATRDDDRDGMHGA